MELIIWTNMGRSLIFSEVENFGFTSQGIEFDYTGASTGVKRHANLNNTSMVGFATSLPVESQAR